MIIKKISLSVKKHISVIEDIPVKTTFDKDAMKRFIEGLNNVETFDLMLDNIKIGYAIIRYDSNDQCHSLDFFEIFENYQNLGYGSWFLDHLKEIYDFCLYAINGTIHFYLKRGAKPILIYSGGIIVAFLRDIKPSEYFKKISGPDEIFEYSDEFVYKKSDWDDIAKRF